MYKSTPIHPISQLTEVAIGTHVCTCMCTCTMIMLLTLTHDGEIRSIDTSFHKEPRAIIERSVDVVCEGTPFEAC